jgi:hypothetical protein
LVSGDRVSITGITTFTASGLEAVVGSTETTTFSLKSDTTGTAVTGQTGSITGLVYYTTNIAHTLDTNVQKLSITGLVRFTISELPVYRVPSTTVFIIQSPSTGAAVTSASGVLTTTVYANSNMALTNNTRVQGLQVVQTRSNPEARATLSFAGTSGALSSSPVQRPGGLPTGFKNSQSTYTRLPQSAGW